MNRSNSAGSGDPVLKLFTDKELSGNVVKLKNSTRNGNTKPSTNWQARAKQLESQDDKPSPTRSPGPVVTQLDDKDISAFATGRPLQDEPDYKVCKHCKKPVLKTVAAEHVRGCFRAKKTERTKERKKKQQREEVAALAAVAAAKDVSKDGDAHTDEVVEGPGTKKKGAKKMAKKDGEPGAKGKKRKADEKLPKEPKAKKKKEKAAKPEPKPKAPVDVEKQCGVPLPNGQLCARSLTCKSHSMGAKRAVMGRSQPYDVLLAAYQKKNQAKQQKAAINAGGPPPEELEANAMPVDSDEETELVMAAIARHVPQPLERPIMIPVRRKAQYIRMRELMQSALRPAGQPLFNSSGGVGGLLGGSIGQNPAPTSGGQKTLQQPPPPAQRKALNVSS